MSPKLEHVANVVDKVADAAGEIIESHYLARGNIASNTHVTSWTRNMSIEVEHAMISVIIKHLPSHSVYAKHSGWSDLNEPIVPEFVWVLDPINGTTDGLLPAFATLIAVLHNGEPVIGCIYNPITGIKTIGRKDGVTTRHGNAVRTRGCEDLEQAYVDIKDPGCDKDAKFAYDRLTYKVGKTFFDGGCVAYSELAAGMLQVVVDSAVDGCSLLGMIPIVEGAGGVITDWEGKRLSWRPSPGCLMELDDMFKVVAAADSRIHQQILSELS